MAFHLFLPGSIQTAEIVTQRKSQSGAPEACPARTGRVYQMNPAFGDPAGATAKNFTSDSHLSAPKKMQSPSSIF